MKTTIEMNGYEIVIEETAGMLSVTAMKDGETVEEFSLETEAQGAEENETEEGGEEVKSFGDFGGEEEDFSGEEEGSEDLENEVEETQDEEESQDEEEEEEEKMESLKTFESFLNKKK